ncbi:MAG TPA: polyprenol monophosphomannose synthase [Phycisphaerae bacterium]|nr:polyprenol monophosphomannose synthase [Phycisphaerae bacterium]
MNVRVNEPEPSPSLEQDERRGGAAAATAIVSVVVPTYCEADNIRPLITRITAAMAQADLQHEIIIVDDNSRDGTEALCAELVADGMPLRLIVRRDERGLSSAVLRGFTEARGDILVCLDADLSHPPEAIPQLVATLERDGADFVIGSRYVAGGTTDQSWGLFRWLNSKVATLLARPFTRARDPMAGFFALRRQTFAAAAPLDPIGYKIGLELIVKCRCRRVMEVPIHFADRRAGESKLNLREQLNYVRHLARLARFKLAGTSAG